MNIFEVPETFYSWEKVSFLIIPNVIISFSKITYLTSIPKKAEKSLEAFPTVHEFLLAITLKVY